MTASGGITARIAGPRHIAPLGPLDPRVAAWRPDLADIGLAGLIAVPNYVAPVAMAVTRQTPLLAAAGDGATTTSELLPGEGFALLDRGLRHGWGYCLHDHYVGYVALDALAPPMAKPTHMIGPGDALLFAAADIKSPVVARLPAGARVTGSLAGAFLETTAGFLHHRHLLPPDGDPALDWTEVARSFLGAPYQWGGRSRAGVDCSGLVQMARLLAGHPCRRDSDMQAADATPVAPGQQQRGDLVWWPGHIGILTAPDTLLHANAHWMRCVEEPLAAVCQRAETNATILRP